MLKKSNSIFFKAFAMGTLLANGGMTMDGDDDKQGKKLDTPSYNSVSSQTPTGAISEIGNRDFHRSLVEPHVRHILTQVDERAEMRRELIRAPKIIDLRGASIRGVSPFHKVIHTLLADARMYRTPIDKLTLLNATEGELAEILSHEDAQYINEFDWTTYTPYNLIDDMEAYDFMAEDNKWGTDLFETSTDGSEEEWIDDSLELTTTDDPDEEWMDDPWYVMDMDDSDDEEWMDDPHAIRDIGNLDEEWIDLGNVMDVDNLDEAQIEGPQNIRNMIGLDEAQVEGPQNIRNMVGLDEAQIEGLRNVRNMVGLDEAQIEGPQNVRNMDNLEGERINDLRDLMDVDNLVEEEQINDPVNLAVVDDLAEEQIDDLLLAAIDDLNEEWIKDPAGLRRNGLYEKLPQLRKAVARARHAPVLSELLQAIEQETIITPPEEDAESNEPLLIKDELFEPSAWNMTLLKDVKEKANLDSQNLGQLSSLEKYKPHSLVHIFCQGNRAQA